MYGIGMQLQESSYLTKKEQYFFPRSKKKRIQKKCRKKYQHDVPSDEIYVIGGRVIAHPVTMTRIKAAINMKAEPL